MRPRGNVKHRRALRNPHPSPKKAELPAPVSHPREQELTLRGHLFTPGAQREDASPAPRWHHCRFPHVQRQPELRAIWARDQGSCKRKQSQAGTQEPWPQSAGPTVLSKALNAEGDRGLSSWPWPCPRPPHSSLRLQASTQRGRRGNPGEGSGRRQVTASQPALSTRVGGAKLGCRLELPGEQASGPATRLTSGPRAGAGVSLPTSLFLRSPLSTAS